MSQEQEFLNATDYGRAVEVPSYIRLYPRAEPETGFGPVRLYELYRQAGNLLYDYGEPRESEDGTALMAPIAAHVSGYGESEFDLELRFGRPDGRLEFVFEDESVVVLSSDACESRRPGDLLLRPGVTCCGYRGCYLTGPKLGAGGTAVVHRVKDTCGTVFAAKCLSPGRFEMEDLVRRFAREASHLEEASHPNIVEYVDQAYDGEDRVLVMELATETLAARLSAAKPELAMALTWLEEALTGLAHLHRLGLVHRDVTPSNMMFDREGRLKLSDFGTVKGDSDPELTMDITGIRLGSLLYISDQQRREPHSAQPADDVFSAGQVGYYMLTGLPPHGNPPPLSAFEAIPPSVGKVVEQMRAFKRSERFHDGSQALEALRPPAGKERPATSAAVGKRSQLKKMQEKK